MADLVSQSTVGGYPLVGSGQPGGSLQLVPLAVPNTPSVAVVAPPSSALSLSAVADSSSTLAATTYYVAIAWQNASGSTPVGSSEASIALSTADADSIQFSATLPTDVTSVLVGMGTASGGEAQYASVSSAAAITYAGTNSAGVSASVSGSTLTITLAAPPSDTAIAMPSSNTCNVNGSGSAAGSDLAASTTYYYAATALAFDGTETPPSGIGSWTEGSTAYPITLNLETVAGAQSLNIYKGTTDHVADLNWLANTTSLSYTDSGDTATTSQIPPVHNHTANAQLGSGATIDAYLSSPNAVSIVAYGADPTGTYNSTTAITNALAAGLSVIIPPGTYLVDDTFTPRSNQTIISLGTLQPTAAGTVWNFDGVLSTQVLGTLAINDPNGITTTADPAINFQGMCRWLYIDRIYMNNVAQPITMSNINESHFVSIHLDACRGDGIVINGDPSNVHDNAFDAIFVGGTSGVAGHGLNFDVTSTGTSGGNRWGKLTLIGNGSSGMAVQGGGMLEQWFDTIIADTNGEHGVHFYGGTLKFFSGKLWTSTNGNNGIFVNGSSSSLAEHIQIGEWYAHNNTGSAAYLQSGMHGLQVGRAMIRNNGGGIVCGASGGGSDNAHLQFGTLYTMGSGAANSNGDYGITDNGDTSVTGLAIGNLMAEDGYSLDAATGLAIPMSARTSTHNLLLTTTTATTVLSYTPKTEGLYTAKVYLRVITASTEVTVTLTYDDSGGSQTYTPAALNAQTLAVGSYSMVDYSFEATPSAAIALTVTAGTANQVYVTSALVGVS